MSLIVQYVIVAVAVAAAIWVSWRKLMGRHVLKRGHKPDGCAGCGSEEEHRR